MDSIPPLRYARWLERSAVNGPGERFVLWVQGCPLRCPGCWNAKMRSSSGGQIVAPEVLAAQVIATKGVEGITLTGGEPFIQPEALATLVKPLRERGLSIMIFTGFELSALKTPAQKTLLELADIVVAGRYIETERSTRQAWIGSKNQRVHFLSERYGPPSIPKTQTFEVHIDACGEAVMTGFPAKLF